MKRIAFLSIFCLFLLNQINAQLGKEQIIVTGLQEPKTIKTFHANGDDFLDLIVRTNDGELSLLLGSGDGTFNAFEIIVPVGINRFSLFDQDGDDDLDILIGKADRQIVWLENTLSGSFETEHFIAESLNGPVGVIEFFDLDNDGDTDVIAGGGSTIFWYENLSDTAYAAKANLTFNANGVRDIYPDDYDNDGDVDILVTTSLVGSRFLENEGGTSFLPPVTISGTDVLSSEAIDLDGDGNKDLLYTWANTGVSWLRSNGDGTFTGASISNDASWPAECHAADLDNDGDLDVLSGSRNDRKLAWYEQTSPGVFDDQQIIDQDFRNPIGIATGDFFEEDLTSMMVISDSESQIMSYRKNSFGIFRDKNIVSPLLNDPEFIHFVDVNNDAVEDVVFRANGDKVYAAYGNCYGSFEPAVAVFTAPSPYGISELSIDDLDNDGDNDLAIDLANPSRTGQFGYVLFKNGAFGDFELIGNGRTDFLKIEDMNGDSLNDILQILDDVGLIYYVNQGNGSFERDNSNIIQGYYLGSVEFEDLDGDGDKDLIEMVGFSGDIRWTENLGNGAFAPQEEYDADTSFSGFELSDADEDGDLDIFTYRAVRENIGWFENTDDSLKFRTFHTLGGIDVGVTYAEITALDLNMDGLKDIVVHKSPTGKAYQLLSKGNGEYEAPELIKENGNLVSDEIAVDIDEDGDEDILFIDIDQHRVAWYGNASFDNGDNELDFTVEVSDPWVCFGEKTANIILTPMPDCGTYSILWEDSGSNDFEQNNLGGGTYTYTISHPAGISVKDSVVINEFPELLVVGGAVNSSPDVSEGIVWATPTGGVPPYSFQWNDPQMSVTDTVFNLSPGDYSVVVTDSYLCQQSLTVTIDRLSSIENLNQLSIQIYPTIVGQDRLHFATTQTYAGSVIFEIIDFQGKIVKKISQNGLKNGDFLKVESLNPGLYLLRIQNPNFQVTKRMIKI